MTDREWRDKIKEAQGGDIKARNEVIMVSMGIVRAIAHEVAEGAGRQDLFEDMCQQAVIGRNGNEGLIRAIQSYDTEGTTTFAAYATKWVRPAMLDMLLPSMYTRGQKDARKRARKAIEAGTGKHAKLAAAIAEGEVFETSVTAIAEGHYRTKSPGNIDHHSDNEDYDVLLARKIVSVEPELTDMIDGDDRRSLLMAAMDLLPQKQRFVLTALCGFNGGHVTTKELASRMGVKWPTVNMLALRATKNLKKIFAKLEAAKAVSAAVCLLTKTP